MVIWLLLFLGSPTYLVSSSFVTSHSHLKDGNKTWNVTTYALARSNDCFVNATDGTSICIGKTFGIFNLTKGQDFFNHSFTANQKKCSCKWSPVPILIPEGPNSIKSSKAKCPGCYVLPECTYGITFDIESVNIAACYTFEFHRAVVEIIRGNVSEVAEFREGHNTIADHKIAVNSANFKEDMKFACRYQGKFIKVKSILNADFYQQHINAINYCNPLVTDCNGDEITSGCRQVPDLFVYSDFPNPSETICYDETSNKFITLEQCLNPNITICFCSDGRFKVKGNMEFTDQILMPAVITLSLSVYNQEEVKINEFVLATFLEEGSCGIESQQIIKCQVNCEGQYWSQLLQIGKNKVNCTVGYTATCGSQFLTCFSPRILKNETSDTSEMDVPFVEALSSNWKLLGIILLLILLLIGGIYCYCKYRSSSQEHHLVVVSPPPTRTAEDQRRLIKHVDETEL